MDIFTTRCSYHNLRNNDILCLFTEENDYLPLIKKLYRVSRHTASTVWIYPFVRGRIFGHININGYVEYNDTKAVQFERRLMKGEYGGIRVDTVYQDYTTLYVYDNCTVYDQPVFEEEEEEEKEEVRPFIAEQPPNY